MTDVTEAQIVDAMTDRGEVRFDSVWLPLYEAAASVRTAAMVLDQAHSLDPHQTDAVCASLKLTYRALMDYVLVVDAEVCRQRSEREERQQAEAAA